MFSIFKLFLNHFAAQLITRVLRISYLFILAMLLAPEDMATYTIGLAQIGTYLGYSAFGQRIFLASRIQKIDKYANTILSNSFTITLLIHILCLFIFIFTSQYFAEDLGQLIAFIALSIAVVSRGLALWVRKVLFAIHESHELPKLALAGRSLELFIGVALILLGKGIVELCILYSLSWAVEAAWSFRLLIIKYAARIRIRLNSKIAKSIMRQSPIYGLVGGTQLLAVNINTLNLGSQGYEPVDIASFAIGTQVLTILLSVPATFGIAIIGLLHGRSRYKMEAAHVDLTLRLALLLSFVFVLLGSPIVQMLLNAAYSSNYPNLSKHFAILAWSIPAYSGLMLTHQILISRKHSIVALVSTSVAIICYLLLCFVLQEPKPEALGWAFVIGSYAGLTVGLSAVHYSKPTANSIYTLVGGLSISCGIAAGFYVFSSLLHNIVVQLGLFIALLVICSLTRYIDFGAVFQTLSINARIFVHKFMSKKL